MTTKELWRYEARRCGWVCLALPIAVVALLWIPLSWSSRSWSGDFWAQWLLGAGFALVVGLCAAAVAAGERMTELALTLPTALSHTMCRRLVLLLVPALSSAVLVVSSTTDGLGTAAPLLGQLLAFTALLTATAAWAGVTLRSPAGASTVVIVAWLATLLVVARLLPEPVTQAVTLLAVAVAVFALAMRRLADGDALIAQEPQ